MMKRTCCALLAIFCLSGCASWDPLGFNGEAEPVEVLVAAPPPAPPDYDFCKRIAAQDAAKDGPTRETQARRQDASFRDCAATFGDV